MGIFFKKQYDIIELPFFLNDTPDENKEVSLIELIFYGLYQEKQMQFRVTFQSPEETNYNSMITCFKQYQNQVYIKIKINQRNIQDFQIDVNDMAVKLSNPEVYHCERICWGAFEK